MCLLLTVSVAIGAHAVAGAQTRAPVLIDDPAAALAGDRADIRDAVARFSSEESGATARRAGRSRFIVSVVPTLGERSPQRVIARRLSRLAPSGSKYDVVLLLVLDERVAVFRMRAQQRLERELGEVGADAFSEPLEAASEAATQSFESGDAGAAAVAGIAELRRQFEGTGTRDTGNDIEPQDWLGWVILVLLVLGPLNLIRALRSRGRLKKFSGGVVPVRDLEVGTAMVSGIAVAPAPLTSPITGTECVYYEHSVEEHWEKFRIEQEKELVPGGPYHEDREVVHERVVKDDGFQPLSSGNEMVPFYIRDATGDVLVYPARAKIEPFVTIAGNVDRSSPYYEVPNVKSPRFLRSGDPTGIRRMREAVVPAGEWDGQVTVVGPVEIEDGVPRFRWNLPWWRGGGKNRFLITLDDPGRAERSERRRMIKGFVIATVSLVGIVAIFLTSDLTGFGT